MNKTIIDSYLTYFDKCQNEDKFCIYIDFPFCLSNCEYCIYRSLNYTQNKGRINEYIDSVIKQLESCSELFKKRTPDSIYFGGGTPSLWPFDALERIKKSIPNYEKIKYKKAELHPSNLNKETMDFWINSMKLCIASIGVQSFDNNSCQKQHRIWVSEDKIKDIVRYFHQHEVWVNIDLVALFGGDTPDYWDIYKKDISTACEKILPDVITTVPNYRTKLDYYEQVSKMRAILTEHCGSIYNPFKPDMLSQDAETILMYGKNDHWIATKEYWDYISKNFRYSCSGILKATSPKHQITLGFGGCGDHKCYSYLPDNSLLFYSFYDYDLGGYHYQYVRKCDE